jgi:uncharacterized integral membrane protein (TIGR00698 family)
MALVFAGAPTRAAGGRIGHLSPGLVVAAAVGLVAVLLEDGERLVLGQPIIEALVAAILVGMVVRNAVRLPVAAAPGISFAGKTVLELGIFLLGASVDLRQVLAAGPMLLAIIALGVGLGITVSFSLGRLIGLPPKLALLVAVGNSICGNSAMAAVAPVIRAEKSEVASSIGLTAIVGVVVVLTLPLLVPLLGLTLYQYGVIAGMTVYSVPQVVAASFSVSQLSGQVATSVKLVRVLFLAPVVLGLGVWQRLRGQRGASGHRPALVPWFVAGFLLLAGLRFLGWLPTTVSVESANASHWLLIVAMAALGLGVELGAVRQAGPRVSTAILGSLAFLVILSATLVGVLHLVG